MPLAKPLAQIGRFGLLPMLLILIVLPMLGLDVRGWLVTGPVQFLERPILHLLGFQAA
jgi:hypothetical protein